MSHTCPAQSNLTLLSLCFAGRYCNIGGTNSYDCPLPALADACLTGYTGVWVVGAKTGEYKGNLSCTEKQSPSPPPPSPPPPSPPPSPPPPPPMPPCATPIDFALVLDESGSMKKPDPDGSMEGPGGLKAFAKQLVSQYSLSEDAARFSVVSFAANATTRVTWLYNAAGINAGIEEMSANGTTSISDGFEAARQLFTDGGRVNATKIVLLLTDGEQTIDAAPGKTLNQTAVDAAALLKGDGVTVFAWGFGDKVSAATLEQIATDSSKTILADNITELTKHLGLLEDGVCNRSPPPPSPSAPPPPPPRPPSLPPLSPPLLVPLPSPPSSPTGATTVDKANSQVPIAVLWALPLCVLVTIALVLIYRRHSRLLRDRANATLSRDRAYFELQLITHRVRTNFEEQVKCTAPCGCRTGPTSITGASLPPGPPSSSAGDSVAQEGVHSAPLSSGEAVANSGVSPTAPTSLAAPASARQQVPNYGPSVPPVTTSYGVRSSMPCNAGPSRPSPAALCSTTSVPSKRPAPSTQAPASFAKINHYQAFCREQRPLLPAGLRSAVREALLGEQWNALSEAQKAHYQTGGIAFYEFCREQRPRLLRLPRLRTAETEDLLGKRWMALSAAEQAKYHIGETSAAELGCGGRANRAEAASAGPSMQLSTLTAGTKTARTNPYQAFCREQRPLLPAGMLNADREALLADRWRALPEAERARYKVVGHARAVAPAQALHAHPATAPAPACAHSAWDAEATTLGDRWSSFWSAKKSKTTAESANAGTLVPLPVRAVPSGAPAAPSAALTAAQPPLPANLARMFDEPFETAVMPSAAPLRLVSHLPPPAQPPPPLEPRVLPAPSASLARPTPPASLAQLIPHAPPGAPAAPAGAPIMPAVPAMLPVATALTPSAAPTESVVAFQQLQQLEQYVERMTDDEAVDMFLIHQQPLP